MAPSRLGGRGRVPPAVFTSHGYYFWVPVVAPLAGGVAGGLLYDRTIRPFLASAPAEK